MPSGVDSPKYLAISGVMGNSRLAYHIVIEIGWVLLPLDHVLNGFCILFDRSEEMLNAGLGPVGAIVYGNFWLGQNQASALGPGRT